MVSPEKKNGSLGDYITDCMSILDANAFPVRCYTCGRPLYGKWKAYLERVKAYRKQEGRSETEDLNYLTPGTTFTAEGRALNDLGLTFECCRVKFLGFVTAPK